MLLSVGLEGLCKNLSVAETRVSTSWGGDLLVDLYDDIILLRILKTFVEDSGRMEV